MAIKLWKFLTTDIRELNLGQAVEVTKTGADAAKAVFELAKAIKEQKHGVQTLKPYVEEISSLLDVLNAPLAQITQSAIPFAPIAITLLKLFYELTKKEPSMEKIVALVSQVAYLESLQAILKEDRVLLDQIGQSPVSETVSQQIKKLGEQDLDDREARIVILYFHESKLAQAFNKVLEQRLQQAGLAETEAKTLTERVARKTNENLLSALADAGDTVKRLVEWYRVGGAERLEKYLSIDDYLEREIQPEPNQKIFDETNITFRDLYVSLKVKMLNDKGELIKDVQENNIEVDIRDWVRDMLDNPNKQQQVLFILGEAGRGKSVFCRMFSDWVRQALHPTFIPIVIRLRQLRTLENNLAQTLGNYLQTFDFVASDSGWLTDKNTRFLFLLDGFDELLLEERPSGGLKEFLQQIADFQSKTHHRFLVTGRPLALQGIERLISQVKNLERAELQQMDDSIRQVWLEKWALKVGAEEAIAFQQFLQFCPEDIEDNLAREPLLLYLLARMHREQHLNVEMFAKAEGIKAKIRIYDESVKWVIEKQRQEQNLRLTGLEHQDLRRVLTEAALCVVQSGNEFARVTMLETRLKDSNNPVAKLIQQARQETSVPDEKRVLNNLLTTFYIKPASGDKSGAVEFAHKSFGEFLFAERLEEAIEDWSKPGDKRRNYYVSTEEMDWEIYDLLGYGALTREIVGYLMALLGENLELDSVRLFERLQSFFLRWCNKEFIDADPPPTLPQKKMRLLKEQRSDQNIQWGQQSVDICVGINVFILLLELHHHAQTRDDLREKIIFYPCGQPNIDGFDAKRLLRIISYSDGLGLFPFIKILRAYLYRANLCEVDLSRANLSRVNLTGANLYRANLYRANLYGANLSEADLSRANLNGANLNGANLNGANHLNGANLNGASLEGTDIRAIKWNNFTTWEFAIALDKAVGVSSALAKQPAFSAAVLCSQYTSLRFKRASLKKQSGLTSNP